MADEKILDNAVLRLAQSPKGRGLRVHEHADCLTVDVLRVLNERGWIEWRTWVRGAHGPELQLRDGSWAGAFVDWTWYLAEYTGDISPEIRLSRYKGEARASELRLSSGGQSGEAATKGWGRRLLAWLSKHIGALVGTLAGGVILAILLRWLGLGP